MTDICAMALDQAHDEAQMGFLDHLEELRRRLFVSAAAILAAGIGVFVGKDWVFDRILFGPSFFKPASRRVQEHVQCTKALYKC